MSRMESIKREYEEYEEQESNEIKLEINRCETQIRERLKEMKQNLKLIKVETNENQVNYLLRALLMEEIS